MKMSFRIAAICLLFNVLFIPKFHAQSVSINTDGSEPDNRTILDVKSNNKGVLLPRMTDSERDALYQDIPEGMLIYNTTVHELQIFYNNFWHPISMGTAIPAQPDPNVTDIDGNVYNSVIIGSQVWLAENLKTKHYRNGDPIPDGTGTGNISGQTEPKYWFVYNDNTENEAAYGLLYTWFTVSDSRHICPNGWHEPIDAEWTTLTDFLGSWNIAGGKLKEVGTTHWNSPNESATNEFGFTALPGGFRNNNGNFGSIGNEGFWFSSTEVDIYMAKSRGMHYNYSYVSLYDYNKSYGFSVRCLRNL